MKYIKKLLLLILVVASILLLGTPKAYAQSNDSNKKEPLEEEVLKNTQATELAVTLNNIFQENRISNRTIIVILVCILMKMMLSILELKLKVYMGSSNT